ncbi:MAG: lipoyl(octanoyl) transferase LipB [bacterium]
MAEDLFRERYGWVLRCGLTSYERALKWQRGLVKMRLEGMARDTIMLVEHPPVITVGRDGHKENYTGCDLTPVFIERGGDATYHGPGQLVAYFIIDIARRGRDLHRFMADLQQGVIDALEKLSIRARQDDEHTGVWVDQHKIASVGVAVKRWVSYHGVAINLNTDLAEFGRINPCGLDAAQMTSAQQLLGREIDIDHFGQVLIEQYARIFVTQYEPIDLDSIAEDIESQAGGYTI